MLSNNKGQELSDEQYWKEIELKASEILPLLDGMNNYAIEHIISTIQSSLRQRLFYQARTEIAQK